MEKRHQKSLILLGLPVLLIAGVGLHTIVQHYDSPPSLLASTASDPVSTEDVTKHPSFREAAADTNNKYLGAAVVWYGALAYSQSQPNGSVKFFIVEDPNDINKTDANSWFWVISSNPDPRQDPGAIIEAYTGLKPAEYDSRDVFRIAGNLAENDCEYDIAKDGKQLCHPTVVLGSLIMRP